MQDEEAKVIVFERGNLLFVFNFHPSESYEKYKVGLHTVYRHYFTLYSALLLGACYSRWVAESLVDTDLSLIAMV